MRPNYSIINLKLPKLPKMANKMAEFREKAASLREAARGGGLLKISKLRGGYFGNFRSQGGVFWLYPPPLLTPEIDSHLNDISSVNFKGQNKPHLYFMSYYRVPWPSHHFNNCSIIVIKKLFESINYSLFQRLLFSECFHQNSGNRFMKFLTDNSRNSFLLSILYIRVEN